VSLGTCIYTKGLMYTMEVRQHYMTLFFLNWSSMSC